ncbi:Conserved hypothetical protein [Anaplasma marginale str. Florida]|uniref:NAD-specific glutamate dehydrogenase C-terminal domain-containing protein n=1 Tax=Anaplasma marginale (strain Florida) TaxID=320483 RepID=B9KIA7_ANAMF|nr:Conserved hypothetical protein [Anaplasma marginale str. Florida]
MDPKIAQRIGGLRFSVFAMDIIHLAESTGADIVAVGKVYFKLRSVLSFSRIRELAMQVDAASPYWQRVAVRNLLDDLSDYQSIITGNIVKRMILEKVDMQKCVDGVVQEHVDSWCTQYKSQLDGYYRFLEDINSTQLDLSRLVLIIRALSVFTAEKDHHV